MTSAARIARQTTNADSALELVTGEGSFTDRIRPVVLVGPITVPFDAPGLQDAGGAPILDLPAGTFLLGMTFDITEPFTGATSKFGVRPTGAAWSTFPGDPPIPSTSREVGTGDGANVHFKTWQPFLAGSLSASPGTPTEVDPSAGTFDLAPAPGDGIAVNATWKIDPARYVGAAESGGEFGGGAFLRDGATLVAYLESGTLTAGSADVYVTVALPAE
jgi:hypothetical protein